MEMELLTLWVLTAFVVGAILGSFICCQVRRIIVREKLHGFKKIKQQPSHCEHCNKRLHWWEMIPVLSWLFLRGKCRSCHATIGLAELFAELGLGLVFAVATYQLSLISPAPGSDLGSLPHLIAFLLFLILSCGLFTVFVFDFLAGEMPLRVLVFCIVVATVFISSEWLFAAANHSFMLGAPILMLASAAVLSGFYFFLSIAPTKPGKQRGAPTQLVGDGDWLVALPLAIVLAHPLLAIANLFLANIIGALIATPFMITKKWKPTTRIPFAPLLIAAFFVVFFCRTLISEMFMVI